jgi:hypothetical protein
MNKRNGLVQGAMDTMLDVVAEERTDDNLYDELAAQAGPGGPREDAFYKVGSVSYQYNKALDEFERVEAGNLAMHVSRSCSQDEKIKRLSLIEARLLSRHHFARTRDSRPALGAQ